MVGFMNEELRRYLRSCIEEKIFPGCVLGVIAGGRTEIISVGNLTYDPFSPKVTETTIYDVASITKAIPTSCLALKMIEENRLDLAARLRASCF
jgi:serine-type D-Ala-D-Ala carboxypeptidase